MKAPISRFTINGNSMLPALKEGQDVISFNWFYKSKIGDIVIVQSESFDYAQDKKFKVQSLKRIKIITEDKVWVEGDNKDGSTDSRHFGPVRMEQVVGKVIYPSTSLRASQVPCPQCGSEVLGIYGRKDAICSNCGFKLACCGEP